ncbi:MAG: GAF domain-containing protein [Chitinophagia bacterium]|nr:GAF domain-containing protein [Chitinophagia bacterium]
MQLNPERLAQVELYKELDFTKGSEFQEIVNLAADICETPVALITLLDKDTCWHRAPYGTDVASMPGEISFCRYTLQEEEMFVIADTKQDNRFTHYPLVAMNPGVRFYAGVPLTVNEDKKVGTLCCLGDKPKQITPVQRKIMGILGRQVAYLMELELNEKLLKKQITEIEEKNAILTKIAYMQSHELRRPVASIIGIMNFIKEEEYNADANYLRMLNEAVMELDEKIHVIVQMT